MNKREEHIDYDLIARFLSGELNDSEREAIDLWVNSSEANRAVMEECRKVFSVSYEPQEKSAPLFESQNAWNKVSGKIGMDETPVIKLEPKSNKGSPLSKNFWIRIAAVMVLGLGTVFYLIQRPDPLTTIATTDSIREILLPDSSEVTLNVNSSLAFASGFGESHRELTIEGKVYFNVKRDETMIFSITTTNGFIDVLGTAFLVEETPGELTVTVERGKVQLQSIDKSVEAILERNERGTLASNSIQKSKVESLNNLYWANKKLIYKQESLGHVLQEMGLIFEKSIQFDSTAISDCRISAVFNDESFESMMNHMALTLDFKYTTSGDVVTVTSNGCTEN